ncbi:integral membrane family protein [Phlyctema vagabunda]|uniref:Integral membrane family protein n=1 Tax=Phlyctema vagabunda TaxID=108571 RepID=A0ABR4PHT6_9HELO
MTNGGAQDAPLVDNPDSNGGPAAILGVTISFMAIGIMLVTLRSYLRIFTLRAFGLDDYLMLIALICFILQSACIMSGVGYGIGRPLLSLSIGDRVNAMRMLILWELTYVATTTFVKASIGASLLRITNSIRWRYILWTGMAVDFSVGIAIFNYILFTCTPVQYQWEAFSPSTPVGHCQPPKDLEIIGYAFLAVTCSVYLLFAISPIIMLWSVQIESRTKYSVMVVLALGLIAMVANLVRVRYLGGVVRSADVLYTVTNDLIWSVIECGMAMITACIATYRPLLNMWRIRVGKASWQGGYKETHGLDDIFVHGIKTTVEGSKIRSTSEEDILGANIVRTLEITVEETDLQKASSYISRES